MIKKCFFIVILLIVLYDIYKTLNISYYLFQLNKTKINNIFDFDNKSISDSDSDSDSNSDSDNDSNNDSDNDNDNDSDNDSDSDSNSDSNSDSDSNKYYEKIKKNNIIIQENIHDYKNTNTILDSSQSDNIRSDNIRSDNIRSDNIYTQSDNIYTQSDNIQSDNIQSDNIRSDNMQSDNIYTQSDNMQSDNIYTQPDNMQSDNIYTQSDNIYTQPDNMQSDNIYSQPDNMQSDNIYTQPDNIYTQPDNNRQIISNKPRIFIPKIIHQPNKPIQNEQKNIIIEEIDINKYGKPYDYKKNDFIQWDFYDPQPWTKIIYKYGKQDPYMFFIKVKIPSLNDYENWKNYLSNINFDPRSGEIIISCQDEETSLSIANLIISNFKGDIKFDEIINKDLIGISIIKCKKYEIVKNKIKDQIKQNMISNTINFNDLNKQPIVIDKKDNKKDDKQSNNFFYYNNNKLKKSIDFDAYDGNEFSFI